MDLMTPTTRLGSRVGARLRPEDREIRSRVWDVLNGADERHMHGVLGLAVRSCTRTAATPGLHRVSNAMQIILSTGLVTSCVCVHLGIQAAHQSVFDNVVSLTSLRYTSFAEVQQVE
eukprot:3497459-Amphidinium_carterae.1